MSDLSFRLLFLRPMRAGGIPYYNSYANTQVEIIKSPVVMQRVLNNPEVRKTLWYQNIWGKDGKGSVDILLRFLLIEYKPQTEVINVAMSGKDPEDCAIVANCVLEEYIKYVNESSVTCLAI